MTNKYSNPEVVVGRDDLTAIGLPRSVAFFIALWSHVDTHLRMVEHVRKKQISLTARDLNNRMVEYMEPVRRYLTLSLSSYRLSCTKEHINSDIRGLFEDFLGVEYDSKDLKDTIVIALHRKMMCDLIDQTIDTSTELFGQGDSKFGEQLLELCRHLISVQDMVEEFATGLSSSQVRTSVVRH